MSDKESEAFTMREKMESIINTNLEVLEIYSKELLNKAKENTKDSAEMDKNLHILNLIDCDLERIQRLQLEEYR
ncbi:MAG: hypothetical protein LBS36_13660 [Oscillospiraceae bacterium]|jgi:hypothetical protein|nr:hypothetical protein [Oscillospiraceae bacterium]